MKKIEKSFKDFKTLFEKHKVTIEEKVEERLVMHIDSYLSELFECISRCESPVEKLFAIELHQELSKSLFNHFPHYIQWSSQKEVTLFEGLNKEVTYRLDFVIEYHNHTTSTDYLFAIEIDGHEFHQKTKEQVKRDKERDRNLMLNGITVIRFTGSEVYKNPYKCASEAMDIVGNYILNLYRN